MQRNQSGFIQCSLIKYTKTPFYRHTVFGEFNEKRIYIFQYIEILFLLLHTYKLILLIKEIELSDLSHFIILSLINATNRCLR